MVQVVFIHTKCIKKHTW